MLIYLNDGDAKEVEICDTPELLEKVFRNKVQRRVLGGNNFIIGKLLAVIAFRWTSILRDGIPNEDIPVIARSPCTSSLQVVKYISRY